MSFLNNLASTGVAFAESPSDRRSIFLSNTVSLIISTIGLILFGIYYLWYGWSVITFAIPVISVLCLSTLVFNHYDLSVISRLWLCLFLPVSIMLLSIYSKITYYDRQEELDYFTFRIVILSSCVFPPVFFSLKERGLLITASGLILLILLSHDPLHNYFNVPYRVDGLIESNYAFTNFVVFFMYLLMTGAVLFMKWISEKNEAKAQILIGELNETNRKLKEKNNEIESQNLEILHQTEKLNSSRLKLSDAYKIIEEQRNLLYVQNKNLSSELIEKNNELTETNNELIKHNNELRQFSYTVSHNLRGPVASLIGLLKIFQPEELLPDNAEIFNHIKSSTQRLDVIIKDLNKIIDIRNDIFQIRQQISLDHEISEIMQVLKREIISHNITVSTNLEALKIIYSVRPMVHSIIYNLVSNAIKYSATDREARIDLTSSEDDKNYIIEVRDNGLGIDLNRDRENLFKLYKRFHHHTEGKGLGLYLVKLQVEALGGSISVASEVNEYTSFVISLKKPANAERQVLYKDKHAEIFFDATLNCIGAAWHQPADNDYRIVLKKLLDFVKVYNTPNYIADFSACTIDYENNLLFTDIIHEAAQNGLTRVAAVINPAWNQVSLSVKEKLEVKGVTLRYFHTLEDSVEWIRKETKLQALKMSL